MIQQKYNQQQKDVASGTKTLNLTLTGPLSTLAAQVRVEIWKQATKDDYDIIIRPWYIHKVLRTSGMPFGELSKAWVWNNTSHIKDNEALVHFQDLVTRYNSLVYLCAVYLCNIHSAAKDFKDLIQLCPGLEKLKLSIGTYEYKAWLEAQFNGARYSYSMRKLPRYIQRIDLQSLWVLLSRRQRLYVADLTSKTSIKQLKGLAFEDQKTAGHNKWVCGEVMDGLD
jgi:hypothetical protein